jgi:hypothetical protein
MKRAMARVMPAVLVPQRAETSLRNSAEFKLPQEYYPLLERDALSLLKKEVDGIMQDLRIGKLKYSEARQGIVNLLNGRKKRPVNMSRMLPCFRLSRC